MKICSTGLTTCGVLESGQGITLGLLDQSGVEVTVQLPFDHAQAILMTIPGLLTRALQSLTGDDTSRYIFALDTWIIEQSNDGTGPILTLATPDGFKVSFNVPPNVCRSLGGTLARESDHSTALEEQAAEERRLSPRTGFN